MNRTDLPMPRETNILGFAATCPVMAALLLFALCLTGCTSPPSVAPLLRVTHEALLAEAERVSADTDRELAYVDQHRDALSDAFDADLAAREASDGLTGQWVRDAVAGYVAARDGLAAHELAVRQRQDAREDNLRTAAEAQQRAIELIEQQDALIRRTRDLMVWREQ